MKNQEFCTGKPVVNAIYRNSAEELIRTAFSCAAGVFRKANYEYRTA
ncbi:MAG: hypothetical protein J6M64_10025 [Oscillospiraceae bacterium]|nr:hypothetical protein [Oscillospiraceae bacterium]